MDWILLANDTCFSLWCNSVRQCRSISVTRADEEGCFYRTGTRRALITSDVIERLSALQWQWIMFERERETRSAILSWKSLWPIRYHQGDIGRWTPMEFNAIHAIPDDIDDIFVLIDAGGDIALDIDRELRSKWQSNQSDGERSAEERTICLSVWQESRRILPLDHSSFPDRSPDRDWRPDEWRATVLARMSHWHRWCHREEYRASSIGNSSSDRVCRYTCPSGRWHVRPFSCGYSAESKGEKSQRRGLFTLTANVEKRTFLNWSFSRSSCQDLRYSFTWEFSSDWRMRSMHGWRSIPIFFLLRPDNPLARPVRYFDRSKPLVLAGRDQYGFSIERPNVDLRVGCEWFDLNAN